MEMKRPYCLGIDVNDQYAVVSCFSQGMEEPESISLLAGRDAYRVPMIVAKRVGAPMWYYGEDAHKMAKVSEVIYVDRLLSRAAGGDIITVDHDQFEARQLLLLFIRKLILLPEKLGRYGSLQDLALTAENLTPSYITLFRWIAQQLKVPEQHVKMVDHKQAFFYFSLSRQKDLWLHDVYLFEYEQQRLYYYALTRDQKTRPQLVSIRQSEDMTLPEEEKDLGFLRILRRAFADQIISTVYLVGEGFEGDWMKDSVNFLCRTRRAFIGRNLFSKGACYAADQGTGAYFGCVYLSENDVKSNVSLLVCSDGRDTMHTLISAGENWFEASGSCEVLLNGKKEIDIYLLPPYAKHPQVRTLSLSDLPDRPPRTTRLLVSAKALSNDRVSITIRDLGFGEFFKSSGQTFDCELLL